MGFRKKLKHGYEKSVDVAIGKKRTGFTDSLNNFLGNIEDAMNDIDKTYADYAVDTSGKTPPYILGDSTEVTRSRRVTLEGFAFELPEDFTEVSDDTQKVYMYKGNEGDLGAYIVTKPYIKIIPATAELPLEKDKAQTAAGICTYCAKNWVPDCGRIVKYFGFTYEGRELLLAAYCRPDVIGSPFEPKLTYILYHAAETLTPQRVLLDKG